MAITNVLRAKHAKRFWSGGGGPNHPWGGTENVLDGGGTSLDWGDSPFMGCGPPIPPMLGTPGPQFLDQQQQLKSQQQQQLSWVVTQLNLI